MSVKPIGYDRTVPAFVEATDGSDLTNLNASNISSGTTSETRGGTGQNNTTIGTGLVTRTGASTYTARSLTQPAAGITVTNPDGVSGNPTLGLANDLAAVEGLSGTGIAVRTAADTWAQRTIAQPAAGITVTNPDGVSGNPTLGLANDLAALEGLASTGLAARTGTDTWAQRTITQPAAGITVTNGNGASGNPTLGLANDLAALEALASTGIAARTGTDTWAQRTITGGTGITVTNGDGASGNPNVAINNAQLSDIQTFTTPGSSTWNKPTVGSTTAIYVIGGAGGAGSGARGPTVSGGGGGAAGGVEYWIGPTSALSASETVIVGSGGTGGAAVTTDNTNGNAGGNGGDSIFLHNGTNWLIGKGGGGGQGGNTNTVSGGTANTLALYAGGNGGNGNVGAGGTSGTAHFDGAGGGGGGGGQTGGTAADGGIAVLPKGGANFGGSAPGGAGSAGTLSFPSVTPGGGGSGGAGSGNGVTPGGAGGNGGNYGGGGGGGGGSANGANSGKGGNGAGGIVIVMTF